MGNIIQMKKKKISSNARSVLGFKKQYKLAISGTSNTGYAVKTDNVTQSLKEYFRGRCPKRFDLETNSSCILREVFTTLSNIYDEAPL